MLLQILFKNVFKVVGSDILEIFNISLSSGVVPACSKHAAVQLLLKKQNLDSSVLSNFRLISTFPLFYIKSFRKESFYSDAVLLKFSQNVWNTVYQSSFKALYSTETTLLQGFLMLF